MTNPHWETETSGVEYRSASKPWNENNFITSEQVTEHGNWLVDLTDSLLGRASYKTGINLDYFTIFGKLRKQ
jgi:hypothetical protein